LPDPQAMFDISYFSRDPRPFFKFAREIYPGQFKPSPCHCFIKLLEEKQKLLRNYTQNIDTLEKVAGIKNVIECHGSFSTASCTKCKVKCTADAIRADIFSQRIPVCTRCQPNVHQSVNASDAVSGSDLRQLVENGIMKPDIVFFGEGLPEEFHTVMAGDKDRCDLLIVIGSSLKVRPVALIPSSIPANVPQILINREQLHHLEFDVELLGDSDVIINQLCHRLGNDWKESCYDSFILKESKELLPVEEEDTNDEGEEGGQQMLDTDTQSVMSNASTDLALRSTVAYSDSGFESSTSSGMVLAKQNIAAASSEAMEAIEKIKTTILEMHQPLIKKRQGSKPVSVNYLEDPSDAVDFETRSFQPFNERISEQHHHHTTCGVNTRHPSVDSTKDRGIVGDCCISAQISNNVIGILPPPITNFGDSGGTKAMNNPFTALPTCTDNKTTPAATVTRTESPLPPQMVSDTEKTSTAVTIRSSAKKYRTAAERLLEGTYYAHDTVSAYVFPGAQVLWSSDVEEEDQENGIGNMYDDVDEDDIDANGGPLSPLLPPSVEAEVVSEITTSAFAICAKRTLPASYSISGDINQAADTELQTDSNKNSSIPSNTTATTCSARETTCDSVSVTMPPSPSPSPQKRACECPPIRGGGSDSNVEANDSSRSSNIGKSECHVPPLKRKRSTDDQKNLAAVYPEVCFDATQSGKIDDTPLLSSGGGGADAGSPKVYATQLVQN
ncbi:NAD-dependent histone deacetylase sirtuin-1-like, partial [Rhagoletis pomonella]|uniref:NAD-dependent histone deacetylase sirtuin-1-like n=1 Tax=Rhagoletis pomonella TaxID=28610 RepID=UPI0017825252